MSSFDARLRLPGHSKLPLGVVVDISHERITLTAGDRRVAGWLLEEVEVASHSDGFHIRVDNEELVLSVADPAKFAIELGIAEKRSKQVVIVGKDKQAVQNSNGHQIGSMEKNGALGPSRPLGGSSPNDEWVEEAKRRIAGIAEALTSDVVSPAEVFAQWLKLLKEINRRHGQGSIRSDQFYRLNTQLLDLIPEPALTPDSATL